MTRDERQEIARVKWIKAKCKGTIQFPTGLGKTYTAFKCISSVLNQRPEYQIIVIVPTTNLKEQWESQLPKWNLQNNVSVYVINSAVKRTYKCDLLVLDEEHKYASELFKLIFECINYKYILGLTATFERLDGKHELISKYCPVIDEVSTIEALANGWISDFKEYLVLIDVDDIEKYNRYNKEFVTHFEFFDFSWDLAMSCIGKDGFKYRSKLRDTLCPNGTPEERKKMFTSITYHATSFMRAVQQRKAFVNNHPKKVEIAQKIIESRMDHKILTFSNNTKMAESIGYGPVYTGKDSKKKGRITMEEFSAQTSGVLNSVKKLVAGADIPNLSVGIVLGQDSSGIRAVQTRGRLIRKEGNKVAEIFNIVIADTIEAKWFEKSHEHEPYTIIDEQGLFDVLEGKDPKPYRKKMKNFQFRY